MNTTNLPFLTRNIFKSIAILFAIVFLGINPLELSADTIPIRLHPDNPHYFEFRGEPTVLITSGEHYSAVQNLDFDYIPYLDELEEHGLNYTRLFNGTYVDGKADELPLYNGSDLVMPVGAPLFPDEINEDRTMGYLAPWARSTTPGYEGGGNKFDLDTYDTAYFNRLEDFVSKAGDRGIVVEVTFYCGFSTKDYWDLSPMNVINNINNVGKFGAAYGHIDDDGNDIGHLYPFTMSSEEEGLLTYVEDLVKHTIDVLKDYDNVIYEICNEPYYAFAESAYYDAELDEHRASYHGISTEWQAHMAQTIFGEQQNHTYKQLVTQNINAYYGAAQEIDASTDPWDVHSFLSFYPEVDILSFHYAARKRLYVDGSIDLNYDLGKAISCDENGNSGNLDRTYRRQAWNYIIAGGGIFNNLDLSYTTNGYEGGQPTNPSDWFGGSPALHDQFNVLADFMNGLDFINMTPDNDLPRSGGVITKMNPSYLSLRCLSNEGVEYAAFVEGGNTVSLTFNLPSNEYIAEWINTTSGEVSKTETFDHSGGSKIIASPYYSNGDIALRVTLANEESGGGSGDTTQPTNPDLVGYWDFNENSGTFTEDKSDNDNHGTLTNNPVWVDGKYGSGVDFDGVNDYIVCGNSNEMDMGQGDFTIAAWVKMDADQLSHPSIVTKGAGGNTDKGYWFMLNNDRLKLYLSNGSQRIKPASNIVDITDDSWHHVAVTLDRDNDVVFYLDGENIGSSDISVFDGDNITGSAKLSVGSWNTSSFTFFDGTIDDVKLLNKALNSNEIDSIAGIYVEPEPDTTSVNLPDPASYWKFDEGSGNVTEDNSPNDNDGNLINNPSWVDGKFDQALSFDGVNDRVNCGNDNSMDIGTGDFSITAWVKMDTDQESHPTFIAKGAGSNSMKGYWFMYNNDKLKFYMSNGNGRIKPSSQSIDLLDDTWHHIAISVDRDADIHFYLDGEPKGSEDVSAYDGINISSSSSLTIGSWQSSSFSFLDGVIDDMRIYNEALSQATIDSIAGLIVPDSGSGDTSNLPPAVAHWTLNETSGTVASDNSGNGYDGSLENNPSWVTGYYGNALQYDGVNDYVDCGNSSGLDMGNGDFSISGWVKMGAGQNSFSTFLAKGAGASYDEGYWFLYKSNKLRIYLSDGSSRISANSDEISIQDNSWHHIAVTIDRDSYISFYVDGVLAGSTSGQFLNGANINSSRILTHGSWMNTSSTFYKGQMDDVRIYNLALTGNNVATLAGAEGNSNAAPVITAQATASPDTLLLPATSNLTVGASDADGDNLVYTWSKVSGPGSITFSPNGSSSSDNTVATVDLAGSYTIEVTVSDGLDSVSSTVSITAIDQPVYSDPIAYWSMDEGSGTTTEDLTGNGNDGNLLNGTGWQTGISGYALDFDGSNDYTDCGANTDLNMGSGDFTILTWVKLNPSQNSLPTFVSKGAGASYDPGFWFLFTNNRLRLYLSNGSVRISANSDALSVYPNVWYHIGVVIDRDGDAIFYIDGTEVGSDNISSVNGSSIISTMSLSLGAWSSVTSTVLNGYMDETRIYDLALSGDEIDYLFGLHSSNKSRIASQQSAESNISVYPNPFNSTTSIQLNVKEEQHLRVLVYDTQGKLVNQLLDKNVTTGQHNIIWDGKDMNGNAVRKGSYIIRFVGDFVNQHRLIIKTN